MQAPDGVWRMQRLYALQPSELKKLGLDEGPARLLWAAVQRKPWSRGSHAAFPLTFRQATAATLLAVHRLRTGQGGASSSKPTLGDLPPEVLDLVLGQAAWPLSSWL